MSIDSEYDLAAVAFAEPLDDSSAWASGASAIDKPVQRDEATESSWAENGSSRWYVTLLGRLNRRLKRGATLAVNRELASLQRFRQRFVQYLSATVGEQNEQLCDLLATVESSAVSIVYLHDVVRLSVCSPGPNSFDLAVDFLSNFDDDLWDVFESFLQTDRARWLRPTSSSHLNDDAGYVLLRALARSNVALSRKISAIGECLARGTVGIREAATHAFADLGIDEATDYLINAANNDPDESVREGAREALDDLKA